MARRGSVLAASALLFAGCSSVSYVRDDVPPPAADGGAADDAAIAADDAGDARARGRCPGPVPLSDPAWKEPPLPQKACTSADLSYLASISTSTATYPDTESAMKSRNPECARCIFSHDVDATWGPVVLVGSAAKGRGFLNSGACFARAPGGSVTCGRVVEQLMLCVDAVGDPDTCPDANTRSACANATAVDPRECGRYDVNTACGGPNSYAALANECRYGFDVIRVMCGGG